MVEGLTLNCKKEVQKPIKARRGRNRKFIERPLNPLEGKKKSGVSINPQKYCDGSKRNKMSPHSAKQKG